MRLHRMQMLLSPSVAYVRSILLEELAKGVDSATRLAADHAVQRMRDNLGAAFGVRAPALVMHLRSTSHVSALHCTPTRLAADTTVQRMRDNLGAAFGVRALATHLQSVKCVDTAVPMRSGPGAAWGCAATLLLAVHGS